MDEADLITRAKRGDDAAFDALVRSYLPAVYTFCVRVIGNREDAEDVTQETFVKAWRSFGKFDPKRELKPWLFQIAKNVAIDRLRKKRAVTFSDIGPDEQEFSETIPDTAPLPDDLFATKEAAQHLARALAVLSPRDRLILVLRYEQGFSFEEIATIMKSPAGTVRSLEHRARARLKDLLTRYATE